MNKICVLITIPIIEALQKLLIGYKMLYHAKYIYEILTEYDLICIKSDD